jgi:hypothetical protein
MNVKGVLLGGNQKEEERQKRGLYGGSYYQTPLRAI